MKNDLVDLNYEICSKEWKLLEKVYSKFKYPAFLEGILRAFLFTLRSLRRVNIFVRKESIIFLVGTHNQNITLSKVADKTDNSILLGFHNFKAKSLDGYVPSFLFYLVGWIYSPRSILQLFNVKDEYQRTALIKRLERVLVSGSGVFVWRLLFWFWKPRMIVISNDHNHWTRSAIKAAKEIGINTSYIPHAYTSKSFPELECSYSFLDSDIQRDLYKKEGFTDKGIIQIVGAVRYENKIKVVDYGNLKGIFICLNLLDSSEFIDSILSRSLIETNEKYSIFVKPHPGDIDRFSFIEKLCEKYNLNYVSPTDDICNFSCQAQVLLGGVTGAHIDALMYGMYPVSFSSWYEGDYYGLVGEGVVQLVDGFCDIAKSYNESFNKVFHMRHRFNQHLLNIQKTPSQIIANQLNMLSNNS
ncbi:hypothetical protein N8214_03410 [Pseudomonadales bacterium]|nr:hypothetical protein [Pseudomonadales bacterium]